MNPPFFHLLITGKVGSSWRVSWVYQTFDNTKTSEYDYSEDAPAPANSIAGQPYNVKGGGIICVRSAKFVIGAHRLLTFPSAVLTPFSVWRWHFWPQVPYLKLPLFHPLQTLKICKNCTYILRTWHVSLLTGSTGTAWRHLPGAELYIDFLNWFIPVILESDII